jgi:hypothetical protein
LGRLGRRQMRVFVESLGRLAGAVPVAVRVIVGGMMFFHGLDKLDRGPAGFGTFSPLRASRWVR